MTATTKTAQEEVATTVATSCHAAPDALKREFHKLNSAEEHVKLVVPACPALSKGSRDLVPVLSEMQSLSSQRGNASSTDRAIVGSDATTDTTYLIPTEVSHVI